MHSIKHRLTIAAAFIAMMVAVPAAAQNNAPENKKITIAMGGKNLYYLPMTIAEKLGYFKEEGLDATIVDFSGGAGGQRGSRLGFL
jgi:sulfonate transport system substrate-binding protein